MPKWLRVIFIAIFGAFIRAASKPVRKVIEKFLIDLEAKAKETQTPIDDELVEFLQVLFKVDQD